MFPPIQFSRLSAYISVDPMPFLNNLLSSEQTRRIKEIGINFFSRIAEFFRSFNHHQPRETNIKAMAMVSCILLVALLVISMLRHRDTRLIPPPTPMPQD